jgi:hypothetical protein
MRTLFTDTKIIEHDGNGGLELVCPQCGDNCVRMQADELHVDGEETRIPIVCAACAQALFLVFYSHGRATAVMAEKNDAIVTRKRPDLEAFLKIADLRGRVVVSRHKDAGTAPTVSAGDWTITADGAPNVGMIHVRAATFPEAVAAFIEAHSNGVADAVRRHTAVLRELENLK